MVVFKKENGDITIMHNHTFSVCNFKHRFDLIHIFNGKIREEKDHEIEERIWERYLNGLGIIQKEPLALEV